MQLFDRDKLQEIMDLYGMTPLKVSNEVKRRVLLFRECYVGAGAGSRCARALNGLSRQAVEHILRGTRQPSADDLGKIATVLKCHVDDFYGDFNA